MSEYDPSSFLSSGPFTDPGPFRPMLSAIVADAGADPRELAERARGLMVHVFWRSAYGLPEGGERARAETNLRSIEERLAAIASARKAAGMEAGSPDPLPPESKTIGNCRDFSLLYAALLREAGIPARLRCGFGTYFMPNHGEDHWVVERWDASAGRWAVSDPQLDAIMIEKMKIGFDPMELPDGAFLSGGEAWLACRGGDDPGRYGIFDLSGWDFVKGDMVRDFAALGDYALLPWDAWGVIEKPYENLDQRDLEALDAAARARPMRCLATLGEAKAALADPRFAVPRRIRTWVGGEAREVDLGPVPGLQ